MGDFPTCPYFSIPACAEYMKRLSSYCKLTLVELPEAKLSKDVGRGGPE